MPDVPFTKGLHTLSDSCHVWLEPDGGWGWSNSGLIVGSGESLLIDTLFDPPMTRTMLADMEPLVEGAPIRTLFNTHSDGDHWFGNQELAEANIIATEVSAAEMVNKGPASLDALRKLPGRVGEFAHDAFGPFEWDDITPTLPATTFDRELTVDVGGVEVQLLRLGPAHTPGDAIAWVASTKTLFTGDLVFAGGTPIVWAGPAQAWVAACNAMDELGAEVIVPGHGGVSDISSVHRVRDYLEYVISTATEFHAAGVPAAEAAKRFPLEPFSELRDGERIVQNVLAVYYELDPDMEHPAQAEVFEQMAELYLAAKSHGHGHGQRRD